jgi:hypothetical protein
MADGRRTLEDIPELMTLKEAAAAVEMTELTLRTAIKRGELEAFIPRGRDASRAGRGQGYRITREALRAYYFGTH